MCIYKKGRDVIASLLKLNKKKKEKFNYLIRREIKKYKTLDNSDDIEQNIYEGIIKYVYHGKFDLINEDFFMKRYLLSRNNYVVNNKDIVRTLVVNFNILKINIKTHDLKFLIEKITSSKYGKKQSNKHDILKISINLQENYVEEFTEETIHCIGIYDPDSEVDIEMKCFVNKYYSSLDENEKLIFTKYFYEDIGYSEMITNNYVKNEYVLKNFIKKTKNYFYDQLVG